MQRGSPVLVVETSVYWELRTLTGKPLGKLSVVVTPINRGEPILFNFLIQTLDLNARFSDQNCSMMMQVKRAFSVSETTVLAFNS